MKQILFFFLLLPSLAIAQTDTVYTVQQGENFYVVTRVIQANGNYVESAQLVGNMPALVDYTKSLLARTASQVTDAFFVIAKADSYWNKAISQSNSFEANTGINPIVQLQQQNDSTLLMDTWQLELPGSTPVPITFSRSVQGKLRASWSGNTNKVVHLVTSTMRIVGFNAAGAMNLYQLNNNLWTNADRNVFIRRTQINWTPYVPISDLR